MKYFSLLLISLVFFACKKDSTVNPIVNDPVLTGDYFPVARSYAWMYTTNALRDSGNAFETFEMKMDTVQFSKGTFWCLLGRLAGGTKWGPIFAIKDSGGVVYSIGDVPPETPYPLFKHQYSSTEAVKESLTVAGKKYEAFKVNYTSPIGRTSTWWFAKDIGLIQETSNQGVSLFSDNNSTKNVFIQTGLLSLTK